MGNLLDRALRIKAGMAPASLDVNDVMRAFCNNVSKDVIDSGRWRDSNEKQKHESEIFKIQKDVLAGRGKLIDFQETCTKWKIMGTK